MKYKEALKVCRKVGTAYANGDSLRAMYALLISQMHGGPAETYFEYLQVSAANDPGITDESRALLRSREAAWNVLMRIKTLPALPSGANVHS